MPTAYQATGVRVICNRGKKQGAVLTTGAAHRDWGLWGEIRFGTRGKGVSKGHERANPKVCVTKLCSTSKEERGIGWGVWTERRTK